MPSVNRSRSSVALHAAQTSGNSPILLPTPVAAEPKVSFELPVPIEKLAEIFGWEQAWIHEKVRDDPKRNPNPMPHHKPGKYLMFYPSEVNAWVKAS